VIERNWTLARPEWVTTPARGNQKKSLVVALKLMALTRWRGNPFSTRQRRVIDRDWTLARFSFPNNNDRDCI